MSDETPETAAPAESGADVLSVSPVAETECPACGAKADTGGIEPFSRIACPSCGAEIDVPGRLGHFTLLRRLGSGGMGTTFLAQDETLGRKCAVKVMQKSVGSDETAFAAFKNEAQSAARLNNPHVAQIYSFGKEGDNPYLAMELVAGGDLAGLAAKTGAPLDPAFVMRVGLEIAEGLQAAEEAGLYHGDVKPDNILFDESGTAKLVDFGIASRSTKGAADELWGTPFYIAPEKVQLKKDSARSDIYSLGATLYHAIAGKPPYDGPDAVAVIKARFEAPPPPLESIRPDVDPEVRRIVARMMDIDWKLRRYPTYKSLISDISKYLESVPADRKRGPLDTLAAAARSATGSIPHQDAAPASGASTAPGGKKKIIIHKNGGPRPAYTQRPAAADASVPVPPPSDSGEAPRLVPDEKKSGPNMVKVAFFGIVAVVGLLVLAGVGYLVHTIRNNAAAEKHAAALVAEAGEVSKRYFELSEELEDAAKKVAAVDSAMSGPIGKISDFVREATGAPWVLPDIEPPAPVTEPEPEAEAPAAKPAKPVGSAFDRYAEKVKADMAFDSVAEAKKQIREDFNALKKGEDKDKYRSLVIEEYSRRMLEDLPLTDEAAEAKPEGEETPAEAPADAAAAAEPAQADPMQEALERHVLPHAKAVRAAMREAERLAQEDAAQFEDLKPTFPVPKLERGVSARKQALATREAALARIGELAVAANKSFGELQRSVAKIERLVKPILAARERQAAEDARQREQERIEEERRAAADRRAAEIRAEVDLVHEVAESHRDLILKGQFEEYQRRMKRLQAELESDAGLDELDLACRRAAALDSLRKWVLDDISSNGMLKFGFRKRFDIAGVSPDGKSLLLKGCPNIPIEKMNVGDWVSLYWLLLDSRPLDRKSIRTFERGEQLKNAAVYCYMFGQQDGVLDERAMETCRSFADKALSYRAGLENELLRLVPPLAEPRPSEAQEEDSADEADASAAQDAPAAVEAAPATSDDAAADAAIDALFSGI